MTKDKELKCFNGLGRALDLAKNYGKDFYYSGDVIDAFKEFVEFHENVRVLAMQAQDTIEKAKAELDKEEATIDSAKIALDEAAASIEYVIDVVIGRLS